MAENIAIASPQHPAKEFLAYEMDCREALQPLLMGILDSAEAAGWDRRIATSTVMFLAARQLSASNSNAVDKASGKPK